MLNCLIVDDEELARTLLETYVSKMPMLNLAAKCKSPVEAMAVLQEENIDLMFLDIQMPEISGLDFLKSLSKPPMVILTTAYKEYALEGYRFNAIDYLLKPIDFNLFFQAVNKAIDRFKAANRVEVISEIPSGLESAPSANKTFLTVRSEHKLIRINFAELLYVQGLSEYVTFHLRQGKVVALKSLKALENELPTSHFIRVHKSYIVSKNAVSGLEGNQLLLGEDKIPIGGSYKAGVVEGLF